MVGDGSMLVYFVASADFSHPPANLSAKDVTVTDGALNEHMLFDIVVQQEAEARNMMPSIYIMTVSHCF